MKLVSVEADGARFTPLPLSVLRFSHRRLSHRGSDRGPRALRAAHWPTEPRLLQSNAGFRGEGKTGVPGGKPLIAEIPVIGSWEESAPRTAHRAPVAQLVIIGL